MIFSNRHAGCPPAQRLQSASCLAKLDQMYVFYVFVHAGSLCMYTRARRARVYECVCVCVCARACVGVGVQIFIPTEAFEHSSKDRTATDANAKQ
eukprot:1658270-Amphidinium_carterae.1